VRRRHPSQAVATIAFIAACGPSTSTTSSTTTPGGDTTVQTAHAPLTPVHAEEVCNRKFALVERGCKQVKTELSKDECIADWNRNLTERGEAAATVGRAVGRCYLDFDSCEEVTQCHDEVLQMASGLQADRLRQCQEVGPDPVALSPADWAIRKGAETTHFSDTPSTKESPIEVCTIPEQMHWLRRVKCDDGTNPFKSFDHAHAARVGNVGEGGKCKAIIDLYEVPCPEQTYEVFIDAYVCPVLQ
jgi:hypothetical protein